MLHIKKWVRILLQVGLLTLVSVAGNQMAAHLPWKVPGNVIGLLMMLLLLFTGVVRLDWVEAGANWLLAELLLFFIPSAVGIVQYRNLTLLSGVRIMLVIGFSTAAVMACTGMVAERMAKHREHHGGGAHGAA